MTGKVINIFIVLVIIAIFYIPFTREVLLMFFISMVIFYILKPCRNFFCSLGYKKNFVSAILVLLLTFGIVVMIIMIFPSIISQGENLQDRLDELDGLLESISKQFENITKIDKINSIITQIYSHINKKLHHFGVKLIEVAVEFGKKAIMALAIPIITYYMLSDYEGTIGKLIFIIPIKFRKGIGKICVDIDKVLKKYILGQLILSGLMGGMITIILFFFGVKYPLYFGIINAIFNLIPYVGPIIASFPVIFVSFSKSIYTGIIITFMLIIIQQVEGDIISPKLIGKFVEFHPMLILFLLLIGGGIGGILGMFLVVPAAIAIKVTLEELDYILLSQKNN